MVAMAVGHNRARSSSGQELVALVHLVCVSVHQPLSHVGRYRFDKDDVRAALLAPIVVVDAD
jgi:hypothetical protein